MKNSCFQIPAESERPADPPSNSSLSRSAFLRAVAWCLAMMWRTSVDWQSKRPLLSRFTAHASIILLAIIAITISGVGVLSPQAFVSGSTNASAFSFKLTSEPEATLTPTLAPPSPDPEPVNVDTIIRLPVPRTTIPERLRAEVITYVIQGGDNIFDIASMFGLSPNTIVWSNREAIKDAPWLIQPGLEIYILPVDGVYHTVRIDETITDIAEAYEVEPSALYNEWNDLEEGESLQEGQLLVIPGGKDEEISWTPPEPEYAVSGASQYSYGVCNGIESTGPGANGWFSLPTGSTRVSGWYFHDPRNPTHIGLDYACRLGDPLYAADNGVVTIAGWSGGYGILVEVRHGNGFVTRYAHFSDIIVGCGQPVYQGQLLGYCGSTGWSSGPHLHYEIRYNGVPQDPLAYQP